MIEILRLGTQAVLSKIGNIHFQSFCSDFSRNLCGDKDGKKMSRLNTSTTQASGKAMLFLFADVTFSQAVTVKTLWCAVWVTNSPQLLTQSLVKGWRYSKRYSLSPPFIRAKILQLDKNIHMI